MIKCLINIALLLLQIIFFLKNWDGNYKYSVETAVDLKDPKIPILCLLLLLVVETGVATFEVNVTPYSQDVTKTQFQQQLTILPYKQTLLRNIYGRKIFHDIS